MNVVAGQHLIQFLRSKTTQMSVSTVYREDIRVGQSLLHLRGRPLFVSMRLGQASRGENVGTRLTGGSYSFKLNTSSGYVLEMGTQSDYLLSVIGLLRQALQDTTGAKPSVMPTTSKSQTTQFQFECSLSTEEILQGLNKFLNDAPSSSFRKASKPVSSLNDKELAALASIGTHGYRALEPDSATVFGHLITLGYVKYNHKRRAYQLTRKGRREREKAFLLEPLQP